MESRQKVEDSFNQAVLESKIQNLRGAAKPVAGEISTIGGRTRRMPKRPAKWGTPEQIEMEHMAVARSLGVA